MGALVERIIAVRDLAKSGRNKLVLDTLADAANAIAAQELVIQELREALKPFADLGVGQGPDDEHDAHPYRLTRGAIRNARSVLQTCGQ